MVAHVNIICLIVGPSSYLGRTRDAWWFTAGSQAFAGHVGLAFVLSQALSALAWHAYTQNAQSLSPGSLATTVSVPLLPGPRGHYIVEDSPVTEFTGITVQHCGNALHVHCYSDI